MNCSRSQAKNHVSLTSVPGPLGGYSMADPTRLDPTRLELVSYYDDYSFLSLYNKNLSAKVTTSSSARGLLTGRWSKLSDDSSMLEVYFYDLAGNVVETVTYGPFDHQSDVTTQYQLCGNPLNVTSRYDNTDISFNNTYGFSNNSLSRSVVKINDISHMTLSQSYDDIGRVTSMRRGSDNHECLMSYNLRGNVTAIEWPDPNINFTQKLFYASGSGNPRYNGLISAMTWKIGKGDNRIRGYRYSYDTLNRLTEAAYGENESLQSNTHRYSERVLTYSANGAIRRFQRHGLKDDGVYGKIDNLHISLDGNYIKSVTDDADPVTRFTASDFNESSLPGAHFEYSPTGALTRDLDRGIDRIEYDDSGNPRKITFIDGAETRYVYTPDGVKVRTVHLTPASMAMPLAAGVVGPRLVADTTDYVGPMIFRSDGSTMVRYDGGFATLNESGTPDFYHYVTDYLGNNRGVLHSASGQFVQVTHYYPFGAVYADMGRGADVQPFKHGDKELDMMHGLYHYDYLARAYDPILCTFTRPDSRAGEFPHISPRAFCANDPVNYVDPDGNKVLLYTSKLPDKTWAKILPFATHSFIYVTSENKYFAYGPEVDIQIFGTSKLSRQFYQSDLDMILGKNQNALKEVFTIAPPDGMTEVEFDQKVIQTAQSFNESKKIVYNIIPTNPTEGNCNSSTYTILKKAGTSEWDLRLIKERIEGRSDGFGLGTAWTKEEQKRAIENQRKLKELFRAIPSDRIFYHDF